MFNNTKIGQIGIDSVARQQCRHCGRNPWRGGTRWQVDPACQSHWQVGSTGQMQPHLTGFNGGEVYRNVLPKTTRGLPKLMLLVATLRRCSIRSQVQHLTEQGQECILGTFLPAVVWPSLEPDGVRSAWLRMLTWDLILPPVAFLSAPFLSFPVQVFSVLIPCLLLETWQFSLSISRRLWNLKEFCMPFFYSLFGSTCWSRLQD